MRWGALIVLGVMAAVAMGAGQGCRSLSGAGLSSVESVVLGPSVSQIQFAGGYGVVFPTAAIATNSAVTVETTQTETVIRIRK